MFEKLALVLSLLPLAVPAANAASFDCARASTAFEQAICAYPELSTQDETLAKAYATALGGLSKPASTIVQQGQRDWLDFAERACTDDAQPQGDAYDQDDVSCLSQLFSSRIRWLEESRMRSGRRIYQLDRYIVMPDPDATADSWNKVATKAFSSPRIDGTDAEAGAFNAMMDRLTAEYGYFSGQSGADVDPETDTSSDAQVQATVDSVTGERISLVVNDWWYGHGAAHGNYAITYVHFLTGENRMLEASDIFSGDAWQQPLAELAVTELNRTIEGGIWEESEQTVAEAVADPARWNFSDKGLVLQFQPYEVTAYAYGAPTVTIPWETLREYMAESADTIVSTY